MRDQDCVAFLQWALPQLGFRWPGFRKVRRRVCRRVARRMAELGVDDLAAYRLVLAQSPDEWQRLDASCRVTISRLFRDHGVFASVVDDVLPELAARAAAAGRETLRAWSAGCACGEEVYTLRILWNLRAAARFPRITLHVLGTDADARVLERARRAVFGDSSVREVPPEWHEAAFERVAGGLQVRPAHRANVDFALGDVRRVAPDGAFDIVSCRNLAFTYFDDTVQLDVLRRIIAHLRPGGALLVGSHERLPAHDLPLSAWAPSIFRHQPR